jgi:hypothetical protein
VDTTGKKLLRALQDRELALARRLRRARNNLDTFGLMAVGVLLMFVLAPFWDGPRMSPELRAFALTMNVAAAGCLTAWGVSNLVWVPLRLRRVRAALGRRTA